MSLGNLVGIRLRSAESNMIGGNTPGAGNVVSGNREAGISLQTQSDRNLIQGNRVGLNSSGDTGPGNGGNGIEVLGSNENQVGGSIPAAGNVVAFNGLAGVLIGYDNGANSESLRTSVRLNSIFSNGGAGIDLVGRTDASGVAGPDANDFKDPDAGPNGLQNFPIVASATSSGGITTVQGTLNSLPGLTFLIDLYSNDSTDANGFGEGKTYLGSVGVITDVNGNAAYTASFPVALSVGQLITATTTRTDTAPYGDTSEFSQAVEAVVMAPPPPPSSPVAPFFTISDVEANEGNSLTKQFVFTVTRNGSTSGTASVQYVTQNQTAGSGDYDAKSGTLNFANGEATKTISITVKGDTKVEGDESFRIILSNPTGAVIAGNNGIGKILNDDAGSPSLPPASKTLSISDAQVLEGNSGTKTMNFTVSLSSAAGSNVVVKYRTQNQTAGSGDYVAKTGVLTFTAGQTSKTISITIKGDTKKEFDETFRVELYENVNASILDGTGIGTIRNDD
jgi:parallel beta-helix repeat protein